MLWKHKQGSIVFRVTLWYSAFIIGLLTLVLGIAYLIAMNVNETNGTARLQASALEMSQDIDDYERFDDGIYYVVYDASGRVVRGSFPRHFKKKLPYSAERVKEFTQRGITYQYFDVKLPDSTQWLRAIRVKASLDRELQLFLLAVLIIAPLLVLGIIFGGYRILKKAFIPIDKLTKTAHEITQDHDYSQRITIPKRNNEISRLALTFNEMLASIERSFEREQQFNNDISHELRTPLAVILAESEYAKKYAENLAESQESAKIINRQALMMKSMVDQILELTRLEAKNETNFAPFDLGKLVLEQTKDQQKVFAKKGIELETTVPTNLEYVGDEVLLKRMVDNLMSNALKFAQTTVKVSLKQVEQTYILTISDDGPGIAQAEQAKIWDKFYQVQTARTKDKESGVGLGLSLVQNIVHLHHGKLQVESVVGQGTTFSVYLPKIE
ncbi:MAG: HAMP domain-containing histidine kinase [Lactobacillus sp.]|nr:HAMP domain-containing histidine kinase [Lactobacillus sp.]